MIALASKNVVVTNRDEGTAVEKSPTTLPCTSLSIADRRLHESSSAMSDTERAMEKRREAREEQYYREVWTKAAHGGPYKKVTLLVAFYYDAVAISIRQ